MMKTKSTILGGAFVAAIALTSCGPTQPEALYSWSNYEDASYNYIKAPSDKTLSELEKCYTKMTDNQKELRKVVPPGILAERAYLLVKQGKKDAAIEMLNREKKLYPESAHFVEKIINQIEKK